MRYSEPLAAEPFDRLSPALAAFARDVFAGLSAPRKTLPCQYFYDARGSQLFEAITELAEYYPTRTETGILREHAASMAAAAGPRAVVVEFGSGSSKKTELLLAALERPRAYIPIDVSHSALDGARRRLAQRMPELEVIPAVGDFCNGVALPSSLLGDRTLGFFPGSTIGNFDPPAARRLLDHFGRLLGDGARLIVGVDLEKDAGRLVKAYDDAQGVTADFNLNLLVRINRELAADFRLDLFQHLALYNEEARRIEMHLISLCDQTVRVLGRPFRFAAGESIHTENSYKYSVERFRALAHAAGWQHARVWTDAGNDFSLHELIRPGT